VAWEKPEFKCEATARQAILEFQIFPWLLSLPTENSEEPFILTL